MIRCQGLSVYFQGSENALENVCLEFAQGKITALVGSSGCGKTTLLRVIAGLQSPTSGTVEFIPALRPASGELSFVFQRPSLMPWLTSSQNVGLPLKLLARGTREEQESQITSMLDQVELRGASEKFPHELSGGMQMRVSIARALASEPRLLLLDEPLAALDEVLREQLGDLILRLWNEKSFTTIMVTHNIAEAVRLSHRIVIMNQGSVIEEFDNDLPWPRAVGIETHPRFPAIYAQVAAALRKGSTIR
jgi:NitT/TauT family transport system ATP-binding protein